MDRKQRTTLGRHAALRNHANIDICLYPSHLPLGGNARETILPRSLRQPSGAAYEALRAPVWLAFEAYKTRF